MYFFRDKLPIIVMIPNRIPYTVKNGKYKGVYNYNQIKNHELQHIRSLNARMESIDKVVEALPELCFAEMGEAEEMRKLLEDSYQAAINAHINGDAEHEDGGGFGTPEAGQPFGDDGKPIKK